MDRRKFVASAALAALGPMAASLLSGCSSGDDKPPIAEYQQLSARAAQILQAVARALFPHAEASDAPYRDVVLALDGRAAGDAGVAALLASAVADLDAAASGDWLAASPGSKLAAVEATQDAPWFGLLLNTAIDAVYRHPEIWALLGYEGSSMEFGGYLNRGFDDIDWLPQAAGEVAS